MQYFGGKFRIAKEVVGVLQEYRLEGQIFVEPFIGAANIMSRMDGERHAYDLHHELIIMWQRLQAGWIPPVSLTRVEYENTKDSGSPEMKGFVGFGCSFSGKYFGGYAIGAKGRNYARGAHNSLLRKISNMGDVIFMESDYIMLDYNDALIYCDPPYNGTTSYSSGLFDTDTFWEWCRIMSKMGNTVIISEYNAPDDFKCIWSKEVKTEIRTKTNGREDRVEKLFIY